MKEKLKAPGRKPKPDAEKKVKSQIFFRPGVLDGYKAAAAERGLTLSQWIDFACEEKLGHAE